MHEKKIMSYTDTNGEDITLYAVKIRVEGTRKVYDGILSHNNRFEDNSNDYLTGGVIGVNEPTTAEEAEALFRVASWSKDFRIDGNGYYIFID